MSNQKIILQTVGSGLLLTLILALVGDHNKIQANAEDIRGDKVLLEEMQKVNIQLLTLQSQILTDVRWLKQELQDKENKD